MEISDELLCLFSAQVTEQRDSYVVEIPRQEVRAGAVQIGGRYQIAVLSTDPTVDADLLDEQAVDSLEPPVAKGDHRTVDIVDIGKHGDGIARTDRGYVLIVPDTEQGERVTVEITDVSESAGFASVIERKPYYE